MTKVVHCKREPYTKYIGRPSPFGNPFSHKAGTLAQFKVETREEAIEKFREWFLSQPELVACAKVELKDQILGCWCKPLACHGDVIARIIDISDSVQTGANPAPRL